MHACSAHPEPADDRAGHRPAEHSVADRLDDRRRRRRTSRAAAPGGSARRARRSVPRDPRSRRGCPSGRPRSRRGSWTSRAAPTTSASRLATRRVTTPRCSDAAEAANASTRACSVRARPGLPPRLGDAVASLPDLRRDALVLSPDPGEELEVVEDVGERRRPDDEREHVGAVGHVEVAQALLEPRERDAVLAAKPLEARCLGRDRPVEGREPRARLRELSFEHGETRLLGVDPGLELAHAPGDGAELLGEHARLLLGRRGSSRSRPISLSTRAFSVPGSPAALPVAPSVAASSAATAAVTRPARRPIIRSSPPCAPSLPRAGRASGAPAPPPAGAGRRRSGSPRRRAGRPGGRPRAP